MNYDEDKIQIKITKRGLLDEAAAADDYLTTGYLKLEVKVETGTIFGPLLHLDSLMLHSSSFVKVSADYTNRMPRALNYTLLQALQTVLTLTLQCKLTAEPVL